MTWGVASATIWTVSIIGPDLRAAATTGAGSASIAISAASKVGCSSLVFTSAEWVAAFAGTVLRGERLELDFLASTIGVS